MGTGNIIVTKRNILTRYLMGLMMKNTITIFVFFISLFALPQILQATAVKRVFWENPNPQFNKFILEFDKVPRYNTVDNLTESNLFYVDLYDLNINYKSRLMDIENDPVLKYVHSISYPSQNVLRLVFYVKQGGSSFRIVQSENPPGLTIYTVPPGGKLPDGIETSKQSVLSNVPAPPVQTPVVSQQVGFQAPTIPQPSKDPSTIPAQLTQSGGKKIIIIDPGHGGTNSGALSRTTINGVQIKEKDLTLQFAYELKKLIDEHPGLTGLLTRVDDSNLGLYERVELSEENVGDYGSLFISLHMNDAPGNPSARGPEVYFLNSKGTEDATVKDVEKMENQEVGVRKNNTQPTILGDIIKDMTQRNLLDWQWESYVFCLTLEKSYIKSPYFASNNRGVKNANFAVLKNFKMPAVLFEIGFISNADELKYLVNSQFQQLTAVMMYNAINAYFAENDPQFKPQYRTLTR